MSETVDPPSLEVLKQQRDRDRSELEELRAENLALRVELKLMRREGNPRPTLLDEIARALLLAALASDPITANNIDGNRVMRTQIYASPIPGSGTRAARDHARTLHRSIQNAIARFDQAAEHNWYPPRPPKEPMVWCRNITCETRNKRIPKYVGPSGSPIELTQCPKCGGRLSDAA